LDYATAGWTGNVLVNLQTGAASGVAGGIANVQNVTGANGPGGYNLLVGNGRNVLTGGTGRRKLLVAGASASTLIGGANWDILIGGTTDYDLQADLASLRAVMDFWAAAEDYGAAVAALTGEGGLLNGTVHGNGGGNTLTGGEGQDLFFGNPDLDLHDWDR